MFYWNACYINLIDLYQLQLKIYKNNEQGFFLKKNQQHFKNCESENCKGKKSWWWPWRQYMVTVTKICLNLGNKESFERKLKLVLLNSLEYNRDMKVHWPIFHEINSRNIKIIFCILLQILGLKQGLFSLVNKFSIKVILYDCLSFLHFIYNWVNSNWKICPQLSFCAWSATFNAPLVHLPFQDKPSTAASFSCSSLKSDRFLNHGHVLFIWFCLPNMEDSLQKYALSKKWMTL